MSSNQDPSTRSSVLTPLDEDFESRPNTPTPQDSVSNRPFELPPRPRAERTTHLPVMPSLTGTNNSSQLDAIQAMMEQMQERLQLQLTQQQQDFQVRMENLFISKGKGADPLPISSDKASAASPPIDKAITEEKAIEPNFARVHQSPYVRQPSYPHSYEQNHADPVPTSHRASTTKIKASDLPKFRGEKGEDVEVWIEQVSAIFEANSCSNAEIVAFLSVILKATALQWFTRLGPKSIVLDVVSLARSSSTTIPQGELPGRKETTLEEERLAIQRGYGGLFRC